MHAINRLFVSLLLASLLASSSAHAELTAHWPLQSNADDAVGSNDGTVNGGVTFSAVGPGGSIPNGADCDSSNTNPISLTSTLNFDSNDDFTIAWWSKLDADDNEGMVMGDTTNPVNYFWFNNASDNLRLRADTGYTSKDFAVPAATRTTMHHYALTFENTGSNAGTLTLYIDGSSFGSQININFGFELTQLGNGYSTAAFALDGVLADVRVYNHTLNSTEVEALYDLGAADSVAIAAYNRAWQRNGSEEADVTMSGTYSADDADAVQVKVLLDADDSTVVDWADVDASLSGGTWSGTVTVPTGGKYYLQARLHDSGDSVLATSDDGATFIVGDIFFCTGQSNMVGRGSTQHAYSGTVDALIIDESGDVADLGSNWSDNALSSTNGCIGPLIMDQIDASEGVPCCFVVNAQGSRAISHWDDDPAGSMYTAIQAQVSALDLNGYSAVLWLQGEDDAAAPTTESNYKTAEANFAAWIASDLPGAPRVISCCINEVSSVTTKDEISAINRAKIANWDDNTTDPGPFPMPINLATDSLHYQADAEQGRLAALFWLAIEDALYGGSNGRGPRISSITGKGTDTLTITFDRDLDTGDTTYTSTIVTVDNDDGTARSVSSVVRAGTRTVTVTLDGDLDGTSPTLTYGPGETLNGATVVKTSAITLPTTSAGISSQPLYAEPAFDEPVIDVTLGPLINHHRRQMSYLQWRNQHSLALAP